MRGWVLLEVMVSVLLVALGVGAILNYQQGLLDRDVRETRSQQVWRQGEQALVLYQMGHSAEYITQLLALPAHWVLKIEDLKVTECHNIQVILLAPENIKAKLERLICPPAEG